jgi:AcrR family transcriptional regulator
MTSEEGVRLREERRVERTTKLEQAKRDLRERREAQRAAYRAEREARHAARHGDRSAQRADRREELLNAAIAGIRQHGPAASMDSLAAEAGITKPILYRHFGDRAGLISAIADRFADTLEADLTTALSQNTAGTRALLVGTIDAFVGYIEREPAVYRYLVRNGNSDPAVDLTGFLDQISNRVALVIGEEARRLGRDSGGAEALAHGIVSFVYGAGDWWVDRRTMPRAQLVAYLADFLWAGFEGLGAQS